MKSIQEIFNHIQEIRGEQKTIRAAYKDALLATGEYKSVTDKIKEMQVRKKQIENDTKHDMAGDFDKLAKLAAEMSSDQEMLSSIALTSYLKGETIGVVDEKNYTYEPIFTVRFRKAQ